jgi:signal transduction histidine kinase
MKEASARHTDGAIDGDVPPLPKGIHRLPNVFIAADPHNISPQVLKQLAYNEKMAELGRISAGVVHELNAPLSVISSASQMILLEEELSDFVREMVARINSEAQRLSQLTRGLLNFSSHDDTRGELDINLTIAFILDFLAYEAARRGVTIIRTLDHHLPVVTVDGNALKQILLNVIMNGLQAMEPDGGKLLVESTSRNDHEVSILISDTGSGIPFVSLDTIFEPYFTTKKPGEGTGLGLFVTRKLVENLGGRISAISEPGEGTTFTITLPTEES